MDSNSWEEREVLLEHNLKETRETEKYEVESYFEAFESRPREVEMDQCETNICRNEIQKLTHKYQNQVTTKSYQLKLHRPKYEDFEEVIRDFENREIQPLSDKLEMIEKQWKTMDVWREVQFINPSPIMKFDREELFRRNETSEKTGADMILRRTIVLCSIFENLMRSFGLKVGDTIDIEEDICDVVGKLMMKVEEPDKHNMLNCMQCAMSNIQTQWMERDGTKLRSEQDGTKLISLLITKKIYNGLNLACVLLEQMILDNKDNNESWMRTVCAEFIHSVVQLIVEPDYRVDIYWNLNFLVKSERLWTFSDLYNLTKNGLLLFRYRHDYFHRYLLIIRNFAVPPSSECLSQEKRIVCPP